MYRESRKKETPSLKGKRSVCMLRETQRSSYLNFTMKDFLFLQSNTILDKQSFFLLLSRGRSTRSKDGATTGGVMDTQILKDVGFWSSASFDFISKGTHPSQDKVDEFRSVCHEMSTQPIKLDFDTRLQHFKSLDLSSKRIPPVASSHCKAQKSFHSGLCAPFIHDVSKSSELHLFLKSSRTATILSWLVRRFRALCTVMKTYKRECSRLLTVTNLCI